MIHGWTRPDPIMATKEVIAPLAGGLLGMILFPGAIFRTLQHFFPNLILDNRFICKWLLSDSTCTEDLR
jgi:E3 ubiquitin-protein ligase MARCH6